MEPGIYGIKTRVQLSFSKKDMEIRIKVEMGHHINNQKLILKFLGDEGLNCN